MIEFIKQASWFDNIVGYPSMVNALDKVKVKKETLYFFLFRESCQLD